MFFKHFISEKQLLGFYISGTLVRNGLKDLEITAKSSEVKTSQHPLEQYTLQFDFPCYVSPVFHKLTTWKLIVTLNAC